MKPLRTTTPLRAITTIIVIALATSITALATWQVPKETLSYDIMYKWGLVNKKAGTVKITTAIPTSGQTFNATLTGATAKWADRFYKVRDTLRANIDRQRLIPYKYEKIALEGGDYTHDQLTFTHSSTIASAQVIHQTKQKKDTEITETRRELKATGITLDMLSSFYYMRHIDYNTMKKGQTIRLNVFSGKQKEILTIHYEGLETIDLDGTKIPTYHITFTFTSDSGNKTSDNMDAWLTTTPAKIPVLLEGKLPVGKVRAIYSNYKSL